MVVPIKLDDKKFSREVPLIANGPTTTQERDSLDVYKKLSEVMYIDTGLLPTEGTGLLSLRQAGNRMQFVYQIAPGIHRVLWGEFEGDEEAEELHLAQPYRIIIGDHVNGNLRGARHFYSPIPIIALNQPLYHCNVPNLNCRGYGGTSVGWICLYHTADYKAQGLSLADSIHETILRTCGDEAYNDQNMSETDGTRFYAAYKPTQSYLWDKHSWQEKSASEGFEWTLDPELWIPVLVGGIDNQNEHVPGGQPLTLEMAMYGNYRAYYPAPHKCPDELNMALFNQIDRDDQVNPKPEEIHSIFTNAFTLAQTPQEQPEVVEAKDTGGIIGKLLIPATEQAWTSKFAAPEVVASVPL